jgi:hypothetical protein
MIIAITGAHQVGKTSLCEKLHEYLVEYELKYEPYYELEESGYVFSEELEVDDYIEQLNYSIKQISSSGDNVIYDRCPVDFYAYIKAIDKSNNILPLFINDEIMSNVDLLVYVPIEKPDLILCDESNFPELRSQVNKILNELVWNYDIDTIEVKGSLSNRTDQVLGKIAEKLKRKK